MKALMYDVYYNYIKNIDKKLGSRILFTDIDTLVYEKSKQII